VKVSVQFLKYVLVAASSAASDWVVFIAIIAVFTHPMIAYGSARFVGALVSFFANKHWSFESSDVQRAPAEAIRFLLLFAFSYVVAISLFYLLTSANLGHYWAKLVADSICFFLNFVVMRYWVYRHPVQSQPVN